MGDKKKPTPDKRQIEELKAFVKALNGAEHNPIEWGAVIAFAAPIVSRIAARIAVKYVAQRLGKRLKRNVPADTADYVADKMTAIVQRLALRK